MLVNGVLTDGQCLHSLPWTIFPVFGFVMFTLINSSWTALPFSRFLLAAGGCGTLILAAVELSVSFLSGWELVISDVAVHSTGELPRSEVPGVHAEPGACVVDADALDEHHGQGACEALGHNVGRPTTPCSKPAWIPWTSSGFGTWRQSWDDYDVEEEDSDNSIVSSIHS